MPKEKRTELQHMRLLAGLLLVVVSGFFIGASLLVHKWPWLAYVRAASEAAMVGACADWFAVVALFRRPFGLPIPHTGIIPRNRDRIGVALGRFISNNFLTPAVLAKRLGKVDVAQWIGSWLSTAAHAHSVAEKTARLLPQILQSLPRERLAVWLTALARRGVAAVPAAPVASRVLSVVWAQGETQQLLTQAIEIAEQSLVTHREVIHETIAQNSSRFVPAWIDSLLSERITKGLQRALVEMRNPEHPWRVSLAHAVDKLVFDLANDPVMQQRGEEVKARLLDSPAFGVQIDDLGRQIVAELDAIVARQDESIVAALEAALLGLGEHIRENQRMQRLLNRWVRRAVLRVLAPRRADIGTYISNVVAQWSAASLAQRLELQIGADLQYIRINGTVIGGLIGLVLFMVSKWLDGTTG
jgi:uncharacterized membrane-anchored protein YjiN (DUF445 family)